MQNKYNVHVSRDTTTFRKMIHVACWFFFSINYQINSFSLFLFPLQMSSRHHQSLIKPLIIPTHMLIILPISITQQHSIIIHQPLTHTNNSSSSNNSNSVIIILTLPLVKDQPVLTINSSMVARGPADLVIKPLQSLQPVKEGLKVTKKTTVSEGIYSTWNGVKSKCHFCLCDNVSHWSK